MQSQRKLPRVFSFEFFPPNTPEGAAKLAQTAKQLAQLKPEFFSVTYGAGGSTRERTLRAVLDLCEAGYAAAPHISCIGSSRESVREILREYRGHGIRHLVALRGDLPSGTAAAGEFQYANQLVAFIREEFGDHFFIEVAAYPEYHPQARTAQEDLANFKRKVEAGANSAITQYFFNADAYLNFVDEFGLLLRLRGFCVHRCISGVSRRFGIADVNRIAQVFEHRAERRQAQHHVVRPARVAHQAEAPDLAGERTEARADLQPELVEQRAPHRASSTPSGR
jgi:hypothetical protein